MKLLMLRTHHFRKDKKKTNIHRVHILDVPKVLELLFNFCISKCRTVQLYHIVFFVPCWQVYPVTFLTLVQEIVWHWEIAYNNEHDIFYITILGYPALMWNQALFMPTKVLLPTPEATIIGRLGRGLVYFFSLFISK